MITTLMVIRSSALRDTLHTPDRYVATAHHHVLSTALHSAHCVCPIAPLSALREGGIGTRFYTLRLYTARLIEGGVPNCRHGEDLELQVIVSITQTEERDVGGTPPAAAACNANIAPQQL